MAFRKLNRRCKAVIGVGITLFVIVYIEILSYVLKTYEWSVFPAHPLSSEHAQESLKVLIVADPQIQGEEDESPLFGVFTRWDSDRYLEKTYALAKHHVQPNVVLFLGDLFDEGSKASDPEYRRYYARFTAIFDLPRRQDPSDIKYIFMPGDNDIGGEGREAISDIKKNWFNKTFGDFYKTESLRIPPVDVHFFKYTAFIPQSSYHYVWTVPDDNNALRVMLSHTPLLEHLSGPVQTVIDATNPVLFLVAHTHKSSFYKVEYGANNVIHSTITRNFLMTTANTYSSKSGFEPEDRRLAPPRDIRFRVSFDKKNFPGTSYEITVPTCSYRMGVPNMGYGYLQIFEDGTVDYTVLWLPSRFHQLYAYLTVYIITKIILTPWVLYRLIRYALSFRRKK